MTALEKLKIEHPEEFDVNGNRVHPEYCPSWYGYTEPDDCMGACKCDECWNREIPDKHGLIKDDLVPIVNQTLYGENAIQEPKVVSMRIKDSGERREFETGAVRDIQEGKGRCDLLPLDVVGKLLEDGIIKSIESFVDSGDERVLGCTLSLFNENLGCDKYTFFLEVSKHFEEGAKKYGEYNWQKGIPTHCYIDSAVRHYLKYLRGDTDEPHDRAFVWNILCCIWTCKHKPELNDYAKRIVKKTETGPKECVISDHPVQEDV